jgi:hypothetical protein
MIEQKHLDQLREAVETQGYDTTDVDFYHPPQYNMRQVLCLCVCVCVCLNRAFIEPY